MHVVTIETPQLGNRSYLLHDGGDGLVVDPVRDVDRIETAAERAGVRIVAVAETHIHNDYVSGGLALARRHRADYLVAAAESVAFDRRPIRVGVRFGVGEAEVEALATPGHTPHHLAFFATPGDGAAPALFSGGSLLYGTVGRTDLLGADRASELTRQQYRSVRGLIERLPSVTRLFPTHGFGSFDRHRGNGRRSLGAPPLRAGQPQAVRLRLLTLPPRESWSWGCRGDRNSKTRVAPLRACGRT